MRFTDGLWRDRIGYKLHKAEKMWSYEIKDNSIRIMVPCHEIRTLADTTGGVSLNFTFSSPYEDMISVRIEHFTGVLDTSPKFKLNKSDPKVDIIDDNETLAISSGKMKAIIQKSGLFSYTFYYDGKPLTGGGNRGACYVTDIDYEANRYADFNAWKEPDCYIRETYIREALDLDVGEYIYGLGERFGPLVKNGQSVDIWNRDGGSCSDQAYKNIPFYLSGKKYGVLVNTPDRVEYEIGSVNVRKVEFSVEGEGLEYIIIGADSPKGVLSKYTAFTGRAIVPPAWSFGLWLSTSWIPDSDEKITMQFIDGMQERKIPLSVFHFDARWMDDFKCCDFVWSKRYGDPKALLKKIRDKGVRVCVWINPYVSQESRLFEEGKQGGYFIKNKDGSVYQSDHWMTGIAIVDVTNPSAKKWYTDRLGEVIDMGVDAVKTDFGERIPVDVVYFDGSDPRKMHNYYPYMYNEMIYDMLEERRGKGEVCVFSRSSTVGTQKFPVNWGGDNDSTYVSMAETLRGGLSFCQSGFGYWAHDISGFEGTATPDLYKRWAAFGMLSTHSRLHGLESYRTPWSFDSESCDVLKFFTNLKCSLMPYLYAGAVKNRDSGEPLMRAMMLDFPDDRACMTLDCQYMLGDSLLVAPIFNDNGDVEFYVPQGGIWINYLDGEHFEGGRWYTRNYDYFSLPLLVRPGSIIAKGSVDDTPVYDYSDNVTYQIFELEQGKTTCVVYNSDQKKVCGITTIRNGNRIECTSNGNNKFMVQLMGVTEVKEASGGTVQTGEIGSLIIPNAGESKLLIVI